MREYLLPLQRVNGIFDPYHARIRAQSNQPTATLTLEATRDAMAGKKTTHLTTTTIFRPRISNALETMPVGKRRKNATILLLHLLRTSNIFAAFAAEFFVPELLWAFRIANWQHADLLTYAAVLLIALLNDAKEAGCECVPELVRSMALFHDVLHAMNTDEQCARVLRGQTKFFVQELLRKEIFLHYFYYWRDGRGKQVGTRRVIIHTILKQ